MKKSIKYLSFFLAASFAVTACKKSFLDVKPKGTNLESSYYRNQTEAYNGLTAVYDVVGWQGGGFVTKEGAVDAGSDDHYAGGGNATDINDLQVFSNYTLSPSVGPSYELWKAGFSGVFRANVLIQKLPNVPMDEGLKSRYKSEATALRAYFYFDLVRLFKYVPLLTESIPADQIYNVEQATPAAVYKQIETDLKAAIADGNIPDKIDITTDGGRLTKGAIHALLGKVYLYEQKWTEAAAEFAEVNGTTPGQENTKYGYKLLANFADLWKTQNKFNSESILEVGHSSKSGGDWSCIACTEGNVLNIIVGPRDYKALKAGAPDYISGYSFLPITKNLFDAIHFDPRNKATVANLDSLKANGIADYTPGYMNTGYFLGKFAGHVADKTTGGGAPELNYPQNLYEIRLADTYLMEAEALIRGAGNTARATALMTAVHTRAYNDGVTHGLAATFENLKRERRLELAGEGHRWFDLVRWGDAATVLGSRGFTAGKNEILPIPLNDLNNTKLKQGKEWGGTL
ncbi:RagB/SusD family nutrient uptake outer membrane protein [Mucilaginibacter sp. OK283]|uniref:RagB/SusD family nutrient uptake outer membrane protein n=1 Tax=Mucilaginibacter sp. OK283 TaxID=1881049 RepID=UPI0008D4AEB7|nr:RagB/SusD family nutrient uptake outer membrane protein [Mucilaginibacter sp. OK283]SEO93482.1 Starch-binding associating with outer membrane [Mucilaginibacter sp. OK283]